MDVFDYLSSLSAVFVFPLSLFAGLGGGLRVFFFSVTNAGVLLFLESYVGVFLSSISLSYLAVEGGLPEAMTLFIALFPRILLVF